MNRGTEPPGEGTILRLRATWSGRAVLVSDRRFGRGFPSRMADGRLLLGALAIAIWAIATAFPASRLWARLDVTALQPSFADARVLTSGWECTRQGFDVLVRNPCDPWHRPVNYPRIWVLPAVLGHGQGLTVPLAAFFFATFLVALLALVGRLGPWATVAYGAALFSPSVLTGVERGNNDLLVLALVAGALVVMARRPAWAAAGLFAAAVLKLYPAPLLLLSLRTTWRLAAVAILAVGVYLLATLGDLRLISTATPRPLHFSYGYLPAAAALGGPGMVVAILAGGAVGLAPMGVSRPVPREAFLAAAGLFATSWLLGADWAYRLLVLLLAMPLAIDWARAGRIIGFVLVMGVVAVEWSVGAAVVPGTLEVVSQALCSGLLGVVAVIAARLLIGEWRNTRVASEALPT